MKMNGVWLLVAMMLWLSGCATTEQKASYTQTEAERLKEMDVPNSFFYQEALEQYRQGSVAVSYLQLWRKYARSGYIAEAVVNRDKLMQIKQELDVGTLSCSAIDWRHFDTRLFFSTTFHLIAQGCYEQLGDDVQAKYHGDAVAFVVDGIFKNRDGSQPYSAFEVATTADAEDLIILTGFKVVDAFIDLGDNNMGLYMVFVVDDPDTAEQKQLYFDYSYFLHRVLDVSYPFGWADHMIESAVVVMMADSDFAYKLAMAKLLIARGRYDDAALEYLAAIEVGSLVANYRLAKLCQKQTLAVLSKDECFDYLLSAAQGGYSFALVELADLVGSGNGIEADQVAFEQLMTSAEPLMPNGAAWFYLAEQHAAEDPQGKAAYMKKAASLGSDLAEEKLLMSQIAALYLKWQENFDTMDATDTEIANDYEKKLAKLAQGGNPKIKTDYAIFLGQRYHQGEKNSEILAQLSAAASSGLPLANYLLGFSYSLGGITTKDNSVAEIYLKTAAEKFYYPAQLQLARLYETDPQKLNKPLAFKWYQMCRNMRGHKCSYAMAVLMLQGHAYGYSDKDALAILEPLAKSGDSDAMNTYGWMLENGRAVKKDVAAALRFYEKSARAENSWGQYNVCRIKYQQKTSDSDVLEAQKWCQKAVDQDNAEAKKLLAKMASTAG